MNTLRLPVWLAILVVSLCPVSAKTVIYPVEAIAELWLLNATDFQTKYGGIDVTGLGVSDEGWYVRYRHENLSLFFGPLPDRETAQKKSWELEAVRDAAIRNRASLSTSKVDYVRFRLSGVYGARGDTPYTGKRGEGEGGEGTEGQGQGSGKDGQGQGADGTGSGGEGDKDGSGQGQSGQNGAGGDVQGEALAGINGTGQGANGSGKSGQSGQKGSQGNRSGSAGGQSGSMGEGNQGMQQVAQIGGAAGSQGSQMGGQSGSAGGAGGQGSPSGQSSSSSSSQSGSQGSGSGSGGPPGAPGSPSSGQPSADPISMVLGLFRKILGL